MKKVFGAISHTGYADGIEPYFQPSIKAACRHITRKEVQIQKRSQTHSFPCIRLQVALSKPCYLPFFMLFFTSNTKISPVRGRLCISAQFPFSRISSTAFISLSFNILIFYQILWCVVVSHFKRRQVSPPPCYCLCSIKSSILHPVRLHIVSIVSVVMGLPSRNRCNVPSESRLSFLIRFVLYPAFFNFCKISL